MLSMDTLGCEQEVIMTWWLGWTGVDLWWSHRWPNYWV